MTQLKTIWRIVCPALAVCSAMEQETLNRLDPVHQDITALLDKMYQLLQITSKLWP